MTPKRRTEIETWLIWKKLCPSLYQLNLYGYYKELPFESGNHPLQTSQVTGFIDEPTGHELLEYEKEKDDSR